jgi:transcriptional regulator CtsR
MKRENIMTNLEQINSDIVEYNAMLDRLQKLRDNDAISQREFHILAVTINNRLHDFASMKIEAEAQESNNV